MKKKKQKQATVTWGPQCGYEDQIDEWYANQSTENAAIRFLIIQHIIKHGTSDMASYFPQKITEESLGRISFPQDKMRSITNVVDEIDSVDPGEVIEIKKSRKDLLDAYEM